MQVVIDQRDVQARPGCGRHPSGCIVAMLLNRAGLLEFGERLRVLDLTFGEGRFWTRLPQVYVVGFDIRRLAWVRRPQKFYHESAENWKKRVADEHFDLVAVDPPFMAYNRGWEKRRHYEDKQCAAGMLLREAEKVARHFNASILVHFIWKTVPYGYDAIAETWWQPFGRFRNGSYVSWWGVLKPSRG